MEIQPKKVRTHCLQTKIMNRRPMALLQAVALLVGLVSSEKLVWSEEFDNLDESVWLHEVTTFPQVQFQAEPRVSNDQIQEENCIFNWGRNNCELCSTHRRSSSTLGTTATIPGFKTEYFMSRKTVQSYINAIMVVKEINIDWQLLFNMYIMLRTFTMFSCKKRDIF